MRFIDPGGRYACDSDASSCATIEKYYNNLEQVSRQFHSPERTYGRIQGALSYLGKPGDFNGVTIKAHVFGGANVRGNNDQHTINLFTAKIAGDARNPAFANRNPGFTTEQLTTAIGASVLTHEAQHGVDANRSGWGWPSSRGQELGTEISAYSTEALIQGAEHLEYGLWGNGWVPSTFSNAILRRAKRSTETWCKNSSGVEGC